MISIVTPTYREAENLPSLADAVAEALAGQPWQYELLVIDDDSRDGSEEICAELARSHPLRLVVRKGERGLATAVICGIERSLGDIVVVMDADLSHPPSAIPEMIRRLQSGESDFVLGSRYVEGGSIHDEWNLVRKLNSIVASTLVRPLCGLRDPMSGFFAIRRANMPVAEQLSPVGYKVALEILVKGDFEHPSEVPIHFAKRRYGRSKLTLRERLDFLRHLGRLYAYALSQHRGS